MSKHPLKQQIAMLLIAGAVVATAFFPTPAQALIPIPPNAFYGTVEIDGQPAPVGTTIEGRGTGVKTDIKGNPITTTEAGKYGGPTANDPKLTVQGDVASETLIEFYVNGVKAECAEPGGSWQSSYPFRSQYVIELNLRVGQGATPTATLTSTPTATPTSTPTATSTRMATTPLTGRSYRTATPTRGVTPTNQPTNSSTGAEATPSATAQPTAVAPTAMPAAVTASPTVAAVAVVSSPTAQTRAGAVVTAPPTVTPAGIVPSATPAQGIQSALPASATAAPATPTERPTSTPAVVAQKLRATSEPIIQPATAVPAKQSPDPTSAESGNKSRSSLVLWAGLAALIGAAVIAGLLAWLYLRSR